AAAIWLVALACGYRFIGTGEGLPDGVDSVYAPMVVNATAEPGLEAVFTEALRQQLMHAGVLGGKGASAVLQGEVTLLGTGPALVRTVAAGAGGSATYRASATLRLKLTRGGQLLAQAEASGSEDFLPDTPPSVPMPRGQNDILVLESQRQVALRRLAEQLTQD